MKNINERYVVEGTTMSSGMHDREDAVTQDTFRVRMEAQCSRIERYRQALVQKEGRPVGQDEAAQEWIERYAESFASDHDAIKCAADVPNGK